MVAVDVVVVGAGHNGLIAAAYLAKAGKRVLVLERADRAGGILRGGEIAPGFLAPGIVHTVGRLRPTVVADLKLERHGFDPIESPVGVHAPQPDGSAVTFWADPVRTADELRARSAADAGAFAGFDARVRAVAGFLARLDAIAPPDVKALSISDVVSGLKLGKAFRGLGARTGRETIRALPMSVADLVQETFEQEAVRGPLAVRGVLYTAMGAWANGTAAVFMTDASAGGGAAGRSVFARGGTDALAATLEAAARSFGAEVRTSATVAAIRARGRRAVGVTLAGGDEVDAGIVVSAADPKTTARLLDPEVLGPDMIWRTGNIRQPGATAKVDLALSGLPAFHGADDPVRLSGRIVIGPSIDDVEKAMDAHKYGRIAETPILEVTIPTLLDPSLAPEGKHVASVVAQAAPRNLRSGDWAGERERLGDIVLATLERYAPGIGSLVEARRIVTPEDLETDYGLAGGHVYHAEPGLDQWFAWRPLNGHARYRFALDGLYLAGSGAHPGGGITGGPGANAARQVLADLRRS